MYCEKKMLKDVKKGEFFSFKDVSELEIITNNLVWVKGSYDRETKRYESFKYEDVNHFNYSRGTRVVYVGFTF